MDQRTKLTILHSAPAFTDYSADAQDFMRDEFAIDFADQDHLYIGYHKPINAFYVQLNAINTTLNEVVFEYYNGTSWSELDVADDTKVLSRSGFVTWERLEDSASFEVDSKDLHWVRIRFDGVTTGVIFQAINLIFADDNDVYAEEPALIDPAFYPNGQTSYILQHVAAKNKIMAELRKLKYVKVTEDGQENINEWDILDIYEMRQAACYYAIGQIYFNFSDDPDDQYWAKYKTYEYKFEETFGLGRLRIDVDDDGKVDEAEKRPIKSMSWSR